MSATISKSLSQVVLLSCVLWVADTASGSICTRTVCEFHLDVRWARTMVYRTPNGRDAFNVVLNGSSLVLAANSFRAGDPRVGQIVESAWVHTGDGYPRTMIEINGQFPGPTLEVMEGAKVVVKVTNHLETEGLTVHFHGMHQRGTTWMDGVPYVSQCPTIPLQSFTYRFVASPAGTHWYHSHFRSQRIDGLHGLFIVHKQVPSMPEFFMVLTDWHHVDSRILTVTSPYDLHNAGPGEHEMRFHGSKHKLFYGDVTAEEKEMAAAEAERRAELLGGHHEAKRDISVRPYEYIKKRRKRHGYASRDFISAPPTFNPMNMYTPLSGVSEMGMKMGHSHGKSPYPDVMNQMYGLSGLLNGRGRYDKRKMPLTVYRVEKGQTYRFRSANVGGHLAFKISIDQHKLTLVASDGAELKPKAYDFLIFFPGESMDFTVEANRNGGKYWVRTQGMHGMHTVDVLGVLDYENKDDEDPESEPNECTPARKCTGFNCPQVAFKPSDNTVCDPIDHVRSLDDASNRHLYASGEGEDDEDVVEYFLNLGFNYGPSINSKKFVYSSSPMFQVEDVGDVPCSPEECKEGCECTHVHYLPFNKTIQFVFTNYDQDEDGTVFGHHSTHLHGHLFAVLKLGYPEYNPENGALIPNHDVDCRDKFCANATWRNKPQDLNLDSPPLKDTVIVPSLGYAVIRFRSDNPGFWLLHCHIDSHSNGGMTLLVGEAKERVLAPPRNFPTCTRFHWTDKDYTEYVSSPKLLLMKENDEKQISLSLPALVAAILASLAFGVTVSLIMVAARATLMSYQRMATSANEHYRTAKTDLQNTCAEKEEEKALLGEEDF